MAGFVDTTVKEIEDRLRELAEEVGKLEAARAALLGSSAGSRRGPGRPPRAAVATGVAQDGPARVARKPGRPRGRRAGGATRANQALELVRQRPGITIPEIATELKIEPNYLYRVMPKLVGSGLVTREGQGWHPAASGSSED